MIYEGVKLSLAAQNNNRGLCDNWNMLVLLQFFSKQDSNYSVQRSFIYEAPVPLIKGRATPNAFINPY